MLVLEAVVFNHDGKRLLSEGGSPRIPAHLYGNLYGKPRTSPPYMGSAMQSSGGATVFASSTPTGGTLTSRLKYPTAHAPAIRP